MKEGFKKGRKRAKEVMKTGEIPIELDTKWDLELGASQGAWARSPNEYMRKLAPAVSIVGRALRAMDVWANSIAFDADINAQEKRIANQEGLKGEVAQNRETELRRQPSNDMVEKAKSFGDILILGLNSDESVGLLKGKNRPINSQDERAYILASLEVVDYVVIFDDDTPFDLINLIKPDVLVKGGDYEGKEIVGQEIAKEVKLVKFIDGRSTSKIIQRIQKL